MKSAYGHIYKISNSFHFHTLGRVVILAMLIKAFFVCLFVLTTKGEQTETSVFERGKKIRKNPEGLVSFNYTEL